MSLEQGQGPDTENRDKQGQTKHQAAGYPHNQGNSQGFKGQSQVQMSRYQILENHGKNRQKHHGDDHRQAG